MGGVHNGEAGVTAGARPGPADEGSTGACGAEGWISDWIDHRHFEELDSTQSFAEREYESFDQGRLTAVSADFQTAGRGTGERQWQASRSQSVLMTFFFRFPEECPTPFVNGNVPNVTKVLACSVVDSLRWASEGLRDPEGQELNFGVKWPNDIVVNGGKIGGILARAVPSPGARLDRVIVGVGINVNTPQEHLDGIHRPVWPATSLRLACGDAKLFDVAALRTHIANRFAAELPTFFQRGFAAFRERLNGLEALMGTRVLFRVHENNVVDGIFEGVDDTGCIILRDLQGETKPYPSGEIIPRLEQ